MGTLAEIVYRQEAPPAILFEDIPGYPKGFRAMSGATNSARRLAIILGFQPPSHPLDVVRAYRDRMKTHRPIPPKVVTKGAVLENVIKTKIDVLKFPAPLLHEHDGGRYLGTRRPRDHARSRARLGQLRHVPLDGAGAGQGRPLDLAGQARGARFGKSTGKPANPAQCSSLAGTIRCFSSRAATRSVSVFRSTTMPRGNRGEPYEVIESELYGLPMPAHAEIVLEGSMHPGETMPEGSVRRIHRLLRGRTLRAARGAHRAHLPSQRSDPGPGVPDGAAVGFLVLEVRDEGRHDLGRGRARGLPGVQGVWVHEPGCARMFNVISIKQAYAGHARQALHLAAACQSGSYLGRFVVVVDDDIDPTNLEQVLWAMCTRCDPVEDIDFIKRAWSGPLDPRLPKGVTWNSRGLFDACRPYEMLKDFPAVVRASDELREKVAQKFRDQIKKH